MRHNREVAVTLLRLLPGSVRQRADVKRVQSREGRNRTNRASTSVPGATVAAYSHREVDMFAALMGAGAMAVFIAVVGIFIDPSSNDKK